MSPSRPPGELAQRAALPGCNAASAHVRSASSCVFTGDARRFAGEFAPAHGAERTARWQSAANSGHGFCATTSSSAGRCAPSLRSLRHRHADEPSNGERGGSVAAKRQSVPSMCRGRMPKRDHGAVHAVHSSRRACGLAALPVTGIRGGRFAVPDARLTARPRAGGSWRAPPADPYRGARVPVTVPAAVSAAWLVCRKVQSSGMVQAEGGAELRSPFRIASDFMDVMAGRARSHPRRERLEQAAAIIAKRMVPRACYAAQTLRSSASGYPPRDR